MANGEVCCILGVCCPPAAVRDRLVAEIAQVSGYDAAGCGPIADWLLARFDLAPKGSIQPLIAQIAAMARAHPPAAV